MNTIEFTGPGHTADRPRSARHNATAGLQGEALILELRTAKAALDRRRRESLRKETPPGPAPKTSPERMLHQFPRLRERLDQFDRSSLQEPVPPKQNDGELRSHNSAAEKATSAAILRASLQGLRTRLKWLVSGDFEAVAASGTFADRIVLTHNDQLKAALRVLILSAATAGGWVTLVPLSGAVVIPGKLVVELSVKKI